MKEQNCLENSKEKEVKIEASKNEEKVQKEYIVTKLENLEEIKDPVKKKLMRNVKIVTTEYGYKYNGPEPYRYENWDIEGNV